MDRNRFICLKLLIIRLLFGVALTCLFCFTVTYAFSNILYASIEYFSAIDPMDPLSRIKPVSHL